MEQTPSDTSALSDQSTQVPIKRKRGRPTTKRLTEDGTPIDEGALTYEEQIFIVSKIAVHEGFGQISKDLREKYGKTYTYSQHQYYMRAPAWLPKIQKYREEFEIRVTDEPLSSKRVRIRELSRAYQKLKEQDQIKDSVVVLTVIRDELEGKSSAGTNITQYNQYNSLSDDDLRKVIAENNRFLEVHSKRQEILEVKPEEQTP